MRQFFPRILPQDERHRAGPAPYGHVHQSVFIAQHVRLVGQAIVKNLPVAPGFVGVAGNRVIFGLRGEVFEMHMLARVRANAGGHEHQPGQHFTAGFKVIGRQELPRLLGQIKQHGVAVEHNVVVVDQCRRLGVGVNFEKRRLVLLTLAGINRYQFIREA